MPTIWGYARISSKKQNIERQIRNILAAYPDAVIVKEVYTGTKFQGRKEFEKLLSKVRSGDTIVFDSVSRMSRTAEAGYELYEKLFIEGIQLMFLKEPHINTETYKQAIQAANLSIRFCSGDTDADDLMESVLGALRKYILSLAKRQIYLAFEQAEKECTDLRQRTREGLETARLNGAQIGLPKGTKLTTKKSIQAKKDILKYSKDFNGELDDKTIIRIIGTTRNTYYKYKKELRESMFQ